MSQVREGTTDMVYRISLFSLRSGRETPGKTKEASVRS